MNTHLKCPLCSGESLSFRFSSVDYFLTKEEFNLHQCDFCGLYLTNPYPDEFASILYYQSQKYYSHPGKRFNPIAILYLLIRKWNVYTKTRLLKKYCRSGNLLDIGAGAGTFLKSCRKAGFRVMGIEKDLEARNYCHLKLGLDVVSPDSAPDIPDSSQDAITLWHVLEHIHNLPEIIDRIMSWLKPGAYLILALPNPDSPDAQFYGKFWAGWDVPRHLYHFSSDTIKLLGKQKGLHLIEIVPMRWDAFYVSILSEQYRQKSLAPFRGLYQGFKSNIKADASMNYSSLTYVFQKPNS